MSGTASISNNKRIARNTVLVYSRMILTIGITLFTSRKMLEVMGVDDFGIYNVVGTFVVLFAFLNTIMAGATQRFLSYDLGKNDLKRFNLTFNISLIAHFIIIGVMFLLAETVGLWFLNYKMEIPPDRMYAANWVYQFSILTSAVRILRVPYNAAIITDEKMSFYAYMGILEVFLGLISVYILTYLDIDKIILYSALVFLSAIIIFFSYRLYCLKKLEGCSFKWLWDKDIFKNIISFSSWSMFGGVANLLAQQGLNVVLNIFYGVTVNASMAIANQVGHGVYSLVSSFQTAFNPQLVKYYAADEHNQFIKLIINASKYSFYLIFILALPLNLNMDIILDIWLPVIPEYTKQFCQIMIVFFTIDALSSALWLAVQATGRIKKYQLIISIVIFMTLPVSYILLKLGFGQVEAVSVKIFINLIAHFTRIIYLKRNIQLPIRKYLYHTLLIPSIIIALSSPIPLFIAYKTDGILSLVITTIISVIIVTLNIYLIGMNRDDKKMIRNFILKKLKHAK